MYTGLQVKKIPPPTNQSKEAITHNSGTWETLRIWICSPDSKGTTSWWISVAAIQWQGEIVTFQVAKLSTTAAKNGAMNHSHYATNSDGKEEWLLIHAVILSVRKWQNSNDILKIFYFTEKYVQILINRPMAAGDQQLAKYRTTKPSQTFLT